MKTSKESPAKWRQLSSPSPTSDMTLFGKLNMFCCSGLFGTKVFGGHLDWEYLHCYLKDDIGSSFTAAQGFVNWPFAKTFKHALQTTAIYFLPSCLVHG
jgi:hypothetical protein